ncbi:hypothetical protein [Erysipelothrix anatis]|nr:hypothetical protein [Erysipelothrix anatis]
MKLYIDLLNRSGRKSYLWMNLMAIKNVNYRASSKHGLYGYTS